MKEKEERFEEQLRDLERKFLAESSEKQMLEE